MALAPTFPEHTRFEILDQDLGGDARDVVIRCTDDAHLRRELPHALGDPRVFAICGDFTTEIVAPSDTFRAARDCWASCITAQAATHDAADAAQEGIMATTTTQPRFTDLTAALSFDEALTLLHDIYRTEARLQSQREPGEPPHELTEAAQSFLTKHEMQRSKAHMIYRGVFIRRLLEAEQRLRKETVEALRDVDLDNYANALETGDYYDHLAL